MTPEEVPLDKSPSISFNKLWRKVLWNLKPICGLSSSFGSVFITKKMFLLVTVCCLFVFVFNLFRYISQNSLKFVCLLNSLGCKSASRMLASWVRSSLYFRLTNNIPSVHKNRPLCLPSNLLFTINLLVRSFFKLSVLYCSAKIQFEDRRV